MTSFENLVASVQFLVAFIWRPVSCNFEPCPLIILVISQDHKRQPPVIYWLINWYICIWVKWPIRPELIPVSVAWLGVFLLLPVYVWDSSLSQINYQHKVRPYQFMFLGGENHCESLVSCRATQHNVPSLCHSHLSPEKIRRRVASAQTRTAWSMFRKAH